MIHERIRELGIKKKWLAKKIGISNVLLSYYLTGSRPMPDKIKKKILEILG